jgi:hypothetical protein
MVLQRFYTSLVQHRFLKKIGNWLLDFVYIQSYVTLLSLPILIAWGLPFSIFSPLGNLVFNPFILIFLLLSSLIFFGALLGIPITWFSYGLDILTRWWLACMNLIPHNSSVGFCEPPWIMLIFIPLITLAIVHHPLTRARNRSIACFTLLFILISGISIFSRSDDILSIPCNNGAITVLHHRKQTIVIDPGFIGQRPSGKQWAQYELIPAITKRTGIAQLNTVICLQPTATILQALEQMCHTTSIERLMIPYWEGAASKGMNRAWYSLKRTAESYGTKISRIGYKEQLVPGCPELAIQPTGNIIKSGDYRYPAIKIAGIFGEKNLSISPVRLG